ncbi:unnamed protein product [Hymenolepis diminuta]|uniref:DUF7041 domain-containing protein n=1 Tax=Hymenolepis diminuta TaxID=6216 RepID=A0A564Z4R9_HYMDI|nr:unnamed protein product [Hymenolepis diminuta]
MISEENYTPSPQISQINPASLRGFLPDHVPGVFMDLESHFKHNNIRSQINKFHVLIKTIPPFLIVQFANIIQKPSPNPYDDLKAAILQRTQPSISERDEIIHIRRIFRYRLLEAIMLKKLPSYTRSIFALKTESIESLAEMADDIIENAGREDSPHLTPCLNQK